MNFSYSISSLHQVTECLLLHSRQLKKIWCFYPWGRVIWFFCKPPYNRDACNVCGNVFLMCLSGYRSNYHEHPHKYVEESFLTVMLWCASVTAVGNNKGGMRHSLASCVISYNNSLLVSLLRCKSENDRENDLEQFKWKHSITHKTFLKVKYKRKTLILCIYVRVKR